MELEKISFRRRCRAARSAAHAGTLDGELALSYALWPRFEHVPSPVIIQEAVRKHALRKRHGPAPRSL
jgi:hypothetical protein